MTTCCTVPSDDFNCLKSACHVVCVSTSLHGLHWAKGLYWRLSTVSVVGMGSRVHFELRLGNPDAIEDVVLSRLDCASPCAFVTGGDSKQGGWATACGNGGRCRVSGTAKEQGHLPALAYRGLITSGARMECEGYCDEPISTIRHLRGHDVNGLLVCLVSVYRYVVWQTIDEPLQSQCSPIAGRVALSRCRVGRLSHALDEITGHTHIL